MMSDDRHHNQQSNHHQKTSTSKLPVTRRSRWSDSKQMLFKCYFERCSFGTVCSTDLLHHVQSHLLLLNNKRSSEEEYPEARNGPNKRRKKKNRNELWNWDNVHWNTAQENDEHRQFRCYLDGCQYSTKRSYNLARHIRSIHIDSILINNQQGTTHGTSMTPTTATKQTNGRRIANGSSGGGHQEDNQGPGGQVFKVHEL